jgi:NAD(P)-dependent dehydrogenase (short-subunit alcohol dehydrogenase family)
LIEETAIMPSSPSTVLVVGASRGLGLGLVREYLRRGWQVIGTVRDAPGRTALHDLAAEQPKRLTIETVDITRPEQVAALRARLDGKRIDLLFVNAGISNGPGETIATVSTEDFTRIMVTNALSPMRVVEALADLVPPSGTIAVMSSGLGSVANNDRGGWEVYRASKASLNTLMRSFAARHRDDPRTLLTIAPGWVRTEMGGPAAEFDVETSIGGVADTIAKRAGTPGLAYLDHAGRIVPW